MKSGKSRLISGAALAVCFSLSVVLSGCADTSEEVSYTQISMAEAVELMESEEDYIILDVRTIEEYEGGHIPGAVCVPNETIGEEAVEGLPDKEQMILIYCRSGNRSKQAAAKLVEQGYTNIYEFGGIIDWNGETVTGND